MCSQAARLDVLFPFQIYLFSQVQGDLEHTRTETNILAKYLEMIYVRSTSLIRKAEQCFLNHRQSLDEILRALQSSLLHQLVPFIMTCLYVGSLDDDIMIAADNQISEMVRLSSVRLIVLFLLQTLHGTLLCFIFLLLLTLDTSLV